MTEPLQRQVDRYTRKLSEISNREIPKAVSSTINRLAKKSRTKVVRRVAQDTRIKIKTIRAKTFLRRSKVSTLKALLSVYSNDVTAVSQLRTSTLLRSARRGTNRKGVRVAGRTFKGAFINVIGRTGQFQVLKRKGSARYPLEVIKIPIKEQVERHGPAEVRSIVEKEFTEIYLKELEFRLKKYAR